MPRLPVLTLLATAALLAPLASRAQPATPGPFRVLASFTGPRFSSDPHTSPDGRFILLARAGALGVYDVATGRTRQSWALGVRRWALGVGRWALGVRR